MKALQIIPSVPRTQPPDRKVVKFSRLRLAQRLLIAAAESDPGLLTDDNWQAGMTAVIALLKKGRR